MLDASQHLSLASSTTSWIGQTKLTLLRTHMVQPVTDIIIASAQHIYGPPPSSSYHGAAARPPPHTAERHYLSHQSATSPLKRAMSHAATDTLPTVTATHHRQPTDQSETNTKFDGYLIANGHTQQAPVAPLPQPERKKRGPKAGAKRAAAAAAGAAALISHDTSSCGNGHSAQNLGTSWQQHSNNHHQRQPSNCDDPYAFYCEPVQATNQYEASNPQVSEDSSVYLAHELTFKRS